MTFAWVYVPKKPVSYIWRPVYSNESVIWLKRSFWLYNWWQFKIGRSLTPAAYRSIHHTTSFVRTCFNNFWFFSSYFPKPGSHPSPFLTVFSESNCLKLGYPQCWWLFYLNWTPSAVEKCSDQGCLPVSLLELLAFNMTFIFIASVVVLIEVRLFMHTWFSYFFSWY